MFDKIGVYIIENIVTNKVYIGSTLVSFDKRFKNHLSSLRKGKHHSRKLQRSFNKHGENSFKFRVLEVCDRRDTRIIEQRWIDKYTPFYNMSLKVGSNDGHTYDTKIKISKLQGGKPIDVCNLDGEVITTVNMQREAAEFVNGNQSKVWKCLEGINYKHRNYRFKYSGEDFTYVNRRYPTKSMLGKKHSEETKSKMGLAMSRGKFKGKLEVYLGDKKVCEYLSLKEASEDLDIKSAGISKSLKTGKLYKGYSFKKIELKEL